MRDLNRSHCWNCSPLPAGSSLWIPLSGRLTSYGQSRYHSFPDYFCPHIIVAGRGRIEVEGEVYEVGPGDMFTLWPSSEILYHDFPDTPWEFYYFHLTGADMKAYVRSLGFSRRQPVCRPIDPEAVTTAFDRIWRTMADKPAGGEYEVLGEMFLLSKRCGHYIVTEPEGEPLVEHALALIDAARNPGGLNVNELCEQLRVSRITLYRQFMTRLRVSPLDYIIRHRLKIARELLAGSGRSIGEIAVLAGFNSDKYFLKTFKQHFGLTPSEFRRRECTR